MPRKPAAEKESLVAWVMKNREEATAKNKQQAAKPINRRSLHKLPPEEVAKHPRYVPLAIWAQLLLGEYAPHQNTLLRWVHDGRIQPQPKKIGKYWCVKVDAEYMPD